MAPPASNGFLVNRENSGWESRDGFPPAAVSGYERAASGDFDRNGWDDLFFMERTGRNGFLYRLADKWEAGQSLSPRDVEGGDLRSEDYDVVFAIDSSGSMASNDREKLRISAAKRFIDRLDPQRDKVAIVSWDDNTDFVYPFSNNFQEAKGRLDQIDADGHTSLDAGLNPAVEEFSLRGRTSGRVARLIVFLTDGKDTWPSPTSGLDAIRRSQALSIKILAVGLGTDLDEPKLREIARQTGGQYLHARDASALNQVFSELVPWSFDFVLGGDFNGDGRDDLFFGSRSGFNRIQISQGGQVAWLKADRTTFAAYAVPEQEAKDADLVVAGDFDGNGTDDLFFFNRSGTNRVQLATPGGGWNAGGTFPVAALDPFDWVLAGDFDGNGRADLLFWGPGVSTIYYSRNGWQASVSDLREDLSRYSQVASGDFDGDGQDELFLLLPNGSNLVADRFADSNWSLVPGLGVIAQTYSAILAGHFRDGDPARDADTSLKDTGVADGLPAPQMTEPTPGSVLQGEEVSFAWATPEPVDAFELKVGDQAGGDNLHKSGPLPGQTLRRSVANLPDDGRTVHVTLLFRRTPTGVWQWRTYTYECIGRPELLSPLPGSALSDPTVTFNWRPAPSASQQFKVGTRQGEGDLYASGVVSGATRSATVMNVPIDGRPVHVTLLYRFGSFLAWKSVDYVFGTERKPELLFPLPGTMIGDPPIRFQWTANNRPVVAWRLTLGTEAGGANLFDSAELPGTTTSQTVAEVTIDGSVLHVTLAYKTAADSPWVAIPYEFGLLTLESYEELLKALNDPVAAAELGIDLSEAKSRLRAHTMELIADLDKKLRAVRGTGQDLEELKLLTDLFNLHILPGIAGADLGAALERGLELMRKLAPNIEARPRELATLFARLARAFELLAAGAQPPQKDELFKLAAEAYELSARALSAVRRGIPSSDASADSAALEKALADNASRAVQCLLKAGRYKAALATAQRLASLLGGAAGPNLVWKTVEALEATYAELSPQEQQELGSLEALRQLKKRALEQMIPLEGDAGRLVKLTIALVRSLIEEGRFADALKELDQVLRHFLKESEENGLPTTMLYNERFIVQVISANRLTPDLIRTYLEAIPEVYRQAVLGMSVNHLGAMGEFQALSLIGVYLATANVDPAVRVFHLQATFRALSQYPDQAAIEANLRLAKFHGEALLAAFSSPPLDADLLASFAEQVAGASVSLRTINEINSLLADPDPGQVDYRALAMSAAGLARWDLFQGCLTRHMTSPSKTLAERLHDVLELLRLLRIRSEQPDVPAESYRMCNRYAQRIAEHALTVSNGELTRLSTRVGSGEIQIHVPPPIAPGVVQVLRERQQGLLLEIRTLAKLSAALAGVLRTEPVIDQVDDLTERVDARVGLVLTAFRGLGPLDAANAARHRALREAIGEIRALRAERDGRIDFLLSLPDPGGRTFGQSEARLEAELERIFDKLNGGRGAREQRAEAENVWGDDADAALQRVLFPKEDPAYVDDEDYYVTRRFELIASYPYWDFTRKRDFSQQIIRREHAFWEQRAEGFLDLFFGKSATSAIRFVASLLGTRAETAIENLGNLDDALRAIDRSLQGEEQLKRMQAFGSEFDRYRKMDPAQVLERKEVRELDAQGNLRTFVREITAVQKAFEALVLLQQANLTAERDRYLFYIDEAADATEEAFTLRKLGEVHYGRSYRVYLNHEETLFAFDSLASELAELHAALLDAAYRPIESIGLRPQLSPQTRVGLEAKGFIVNGRYAIPSDAQLKQMHVTLGTDSVKEEGILWTIDKMVTPKDIVLTAATIAIPGAVAGQAARAFVAASRVQKALAFINATRVGQALPLARVASTGLNYAVNATVFTALSRTARVALDPDLLFERDFQDSDLFLKELSHNFLIIGALGQVGTRIAQPLSSRLVAAAGESVVKRAAAKLLAGSGTVVLEAGVLTGLNQVLTGNTMSLDSFVQNLVLVLELKALNGALHRSDPKAAEFYEKLLDKAQARATTPEPGARIANVAPRASSPVADAVREITGDGLVSVEEARVVSELSKELNAEVVVSVRNESGVRILEARLVEPGSGRDAYPSDSSFIRNVPGDLPIHLQDTTTLPEPGPVPARPRPVTMEQLTTILSRFADLGSDVIVSEAPVRVSLPPRPTTPPSPPPSLRVTFRDPNGVARTFEATGFLGKGATTQAFQSREVLTKDEAWVIRVTDISNPTVRALERFGLEVLERRVDKTRLRVVERRPAEDWPVIDVEGSGLPENRRIELFRFQDNFGSDVLQRQGNRFTRGQLIAIDRGIRALNEAGYAWLDAKPANFAFDSLPGNDNWILVVTDPGGIYACSNPTNARKLQAYLNDPEPAILTGWTQRPRSVPQVKQRIINIFVRGFGDGLIQDNLLPPDALKTLFGFPYGLMDYPTVHQLFRAGTQTDADLLYQRLPTDSPDFGPGGQRPGSPELNQVFRQVLAMPVAEGQPFTARLAGELFEHNVNQQDVARIQEMFRFREAQTEEVSRLETVRLHRAAAPPGATEIDWITGRAAFATEVQRGVDALIEHAAKQGHRGAQALVADLGSRRVRIVLDPNLVVLIQRVVDPLTGEVIIRVNPYSAPTVRGSPAMPAVPATSYYVLRSLSDLAGSLVNEYVQAAGYGEVRAWQEQNWFTQVVGDALVAAKEGELALHPEVATDPLFPIIRFRPPASDNLGAEEKQILNEFVSFEIRRAQPIDSLTSQTQSNPLAHTVPYSSVEPALSDGLPIPVLAESDESSAAILAGPSHRLDTISAQVFVLADITGDGEAERVYRTAAGIIAEALDPGSQTYVRLPGVLWAEELKLNPTTYPVFVARFAPDRRTAVVARLAEGFRAWFYESDQQQWVLQPGVVPLRDADGYGSVGYHLMADVTGDGLVDLLSLNCCRLFAHSFDAITGWRQLPGSIDSLAFSEGSNLRVADITGDHRAEVLHIDANYLRAWAYDPVAGRWIGLPGVPLYWDSASWWKSIQVINGSVHAQGDHGHLTATYNPARQRWDYPLARSDAGSPSDILFVKYEWSCRTINDRWTLTQVDSWLSGGRVLESRIPLFESEISCLQPPPPVPEFLMGYAIPAQELLSDARALGWDRTDRYQRLQLIDGRYHADGALGHLTASYNPEKQQWAFPLALSSPQSPGDLLFVRYEWNCISDQWTLLQIDTWRRADGSTTQNRITLVETGISCLRPAPLLPAGLLAYQQPAAETLRSAPLAVQSEPFTLQDGGFRMNAPSNDVWVMADLTGDGQAERISWSDTGIAAAGYDPRTASYEPIGRKLFWLSENFSSPVNAVFVATILPNSQAAIVVHFSDGVYSWTLDASGQSWIRLAGRIPFPGPVFVADVTGDGVAEVLSQSRHALEAFSYDRNAGQWRLLPGSIDAISEANRFNEPLMAYYVRVADVTGDRKAEVVYWNGFLNALTYDPVAGRWNSLPPIPLPYSAQIDPNNFRTLDIKGGLLRAEGDYGDVVARYLPEAGRWDYLLALSSQPHPDSALHVSYRWSCDQGYWTLLQKDSWQRHAVPNLPWLDRQMEIPILRSTVLCTEPVPAVPPLDHVVDLARLTSALAAESIPVPELPPPFLVIELSAGNLRLSWEDPLAEYRVEVAEDPTGPWNPITPTISTSSWSTRFFTDLPVETHLFYRLIKP
jgi:Mg-chelatase subunit ChlD